MSEVKETSQGMTKAEQLKALFLECGLSPTEDIHKHKHYVIITRTGIEKIQYFKKIDVRFEIVQCTPQFAAVKAIGTMSVGDTIEIIETYGSCSPETATNKYYLEMAEKRALSRVVLKMTKAYSLGVFGEDEADECKKS
jgi:hypothetical protein